MKTRKMVALLTIAALVSITTHADNDKMPYTIEIKNLEIEDDIYTPYYEISTAQDHKQGAAKKWLRIGVEFETSGGWIDVLTVKQMVLAKGLEKDKSVELSSIVEYINLNSGTHKVYVYMHPSYVERFNIDASELDSAVQFRINGKVVAEKETYDNSKKGWSKAPEKITYHGYLLDQSETPFWFVNYDFNEVIKHRQKYKTGTFLIHTND